MERGLQDGKNRGRWVQRGDSKEAKGYTNARIKKETRGINVCKKK